MASVFKLVIGFIAIIILAFLWIPLYEAFGGVGGFVDTFNSQTTDPDIITNNNTARQIFYWTLFAMILMIFIWILKEDRPNVAFQPQ